VGGPAGMGVVAQEILHPPHGRTCRGGRRVHRSCAATADPGPPTAGRRSAPGLTGTLAWHLARHLARYLARNLARSPKCRVPERPDPAHQALAPASPGPCPSCPSRPPRRLLTGRRRGPPPRPQHRSAGATRPGRRAIAGWPGSRSARPAGRAGPPRLQAGPGFRRQGAGKRVSCRICKELHQV
jgi:hypothetical protein